MELARSTDVTIRSSDGLELPGTMCIPDAPRGAAVLVHGGAGMDRHEGGMFDRFSAALAEAGIASTRFDHRLFLGTKDESLELSLAGIESDIRAAIRHTRACISPQRLQLCGSSFGGGATALVASELGEQLHSLVLVNPLLDYRARLLEEKSFWKNGTLTTEAARLLRQQGWLPHGDDIRMGRCLINEAAGFDARLLVSRVLTPTLIAHGTADQRIPHAASQELAALLPRGELWSVEGADHGIVEKDDANSTHRRTLEWQRLLFAKAIALFGR